MTPKNFYDWQTAGGTDDVMRLVDCLEQSTIQISLPNFFFTKRLNLKRKKDHDLSPPASGYFRGGST